MAKFVILIFALISLLNPHKVLSDTAKTDKDEAINEVNNILKETNKIIDAIELEEDYFSNNYTEQINKVVTSADPISEFEKLKNTIKQINKITKNATETEVISTCSYGAWNMTYQYVKEHEASKDSCTFKTHASNIAISSLLYLLRVRCTEVATNIKQEFVICINDKSDLEVIKCLNKLAKIKEKVTTINKEFTQQTIVFHDRANKSLKNLETCLENIPQFTSKQNTVLKELEECLKNGAAIIYSQSIIFFSFLLFCLLRKI